MQGLIDSHCHLNYDYSPKSREDILREAREAGVTTLITVGTEFGTISEVQAISEQHPEVFHSIGIHPHDANTFGESDSEVLASFQKLETAARNPKCLAIGEIGLDYHYDHSPREIQRLRLDQQLELALKLRLPVIIHSREAEEDLLRSLTEYAKKVPAGDIPGVIHCFSGTRAFGEACLTLGFSISFSGILTFKNAEELRECARHFPMDKILVETDSPYLAPVPYRGKKCEPSMVKFTAQKLAELKGLSMDEVTRITAANSQRLFRIPTPSPNPA
jgi:TatD DNase family protein